jgi:hypothetical protein
MDSPSNCITSRFILSNVTRKHEKEVPWTEPYGPDTKNAFALRFTVQMHRSSKVLGPNTMFTQTGLLSVDIIAQLVVSCISTNFLYYLGRKFGRQSHSVIIGKAHVRFSAWHVMTQSASRVTALASLNLGAR